MDKIVISNRRYLELQKVLSLESEEYFYFTLPMKLDSSRLLYFLRHLNGFNLYLWFEPYKSYSSYGIYVKRVKKNDFELDLFGKKVVNSHIYLLNFCPSFPRCVDEFLKKYCIVNYEKN